MSSFVYNWFKANTDAGVIREPVCKCRDNIIAVAKDGNSFLPKTARSAPSDSGEFFVGFCHFFIARPSCPW